MTEAEVLAARWREKNPEGECCRDAMLNQLRTACVKEGAERPASLDLRGIGLGGEDLEGLDLSRYDFSGADLTEARLEGANLSWCNFSSATLYKARLDGAEFLGADLRGADLNECSAARTGFGGVKLSRASLINAHMPGATLSEARMDAADLRAANLEGATLRGVDLRGANFTRAVLRNTDLKESDVDGTVFSMADLREARLLGIRNFQGSSWIGADIRGIDLRGAYLVRRFIMDENYLYEFKTRGRFHNAVYWLWWLTSDCGRSIGRWAICIFAVAMLFAVLYSQVDIEYRGNPTFFSPLYYSIVTLTTLGYGDVVPVSVPAQALAALEAILGYVGLGGLLSILANKMARRAD